MLHIIQFVIFDIKIYCNVMTYTEVCVVCMVLEYLPLPEHYHAYRVNSKRVSLVKQLETIWSHCKLF